LTHPRRARKSDRVLTLVLLAGFFGAIYAPVGATGTARVQHPDGSVKTYTNVRININQQSMTLVSSDGVGTLYIGHAACTKQGELIRCFPYDATLDQHGTRTHIVLQGGTVWLNPTSEKLPLPNSSTQLPSHGVLMSMHTKAGTYMSLTGTADEIQK
jgi:hypothetical protein